jgi:RNA polymerase sigma-70 factor (ECF subfamily)
MEIAVTGPTDDDELAALVARARGDPSAFDELAGRVRSRVRRWARRFVRDDDDAEDVAQLVLLRLHQRIEAFEGRSRLGSWLYRITQNLALERRRVEARRQALLALEAARRAEAADPSFDRASASDAARIARLAAGYLALLPRRQREVFELVELRGLTAADAAARLRIEPATARVLLLRARRAIRVRMLADHPRLLEEYRS